MKSFGSLISRSARVVLPMFLFLFLAGPGGGGPVKIVVDADCTGAGCPCVDTSGTPIGKDKLCPL